MIIRRIDEIAKNLAIYLSNVDVISKEEKDYIIYTKFDKSIDIGCETKLKKCFDIIKKRCSGITTEEEFFDTLELEVGINKEELEELKNMNIAYTKTPIMVLPEFTEEIER